MWRYKFLANLSIVLVSLACASVYGDELRAFYLPTFSLISSPSTQISQAITKALAYNFNAIFIQVRVRGDAYHYPNRQDSTYPNPEPRCELYYNMNNQDLDLLQYCIDEARRQSQAAGKKLEVHAWLTTFITWTSDWTPTSPNHPYLAHADWITYDQSGVKATYVDEAPLEHNLPQVTDYVYNIFMDVVRNYDIDGIHFDYIRLISPAHGYHPSAKARFKTVTGWDLATDGAAGDVWMAWQRENVSDLVERVCRKTHEEKPWVKVSAFVINWSDPVAARASAINQWTQRGYMDFVLGSYYQNTVSGSDTSYNMFYNYVSNNGQWSRPFGAALGSDDSYTNTPQSMRDIITNLRGKSLPPVGYCHFAYAGLAANSDERFHGLKDSSSYPYYTWANIPSSLYLNPVDTVAPNAPANAHLTAQNNQATVTFDRPAQASDGEYPVEYRIYRSTSSSVDPAWDNLQMVFWDKSASRPSFSWTDPSIVGGSYYYKIESYDDWHNRAFTTVGPVTGQGQTVIIDDGGSGYTQTGSWSTSSTSGYNNGTYRYASTGGAAATARWNPALSYAGAYEVAVWYQAGTNRANNAPYTVFFNGGSQTVTVDQTTTSAQWVVLGTFNFGVGSGGYVELSDQCQASKVVIADAVRFAPAGTTTNPTPWETKPLLADPYLPQVQTELIIDNQPDKLDYDDGSDFWEHVTSGTYGSDARLCQLPKPAAAVWTAHITLAGAYTIDAYIINDSRFTSQAKYRYVNSAGSTVIRAVSQQSRGAGWINVDGGTNPMFNTGRVFISLSSDDPNSKLLYADALRLRYVGATPTPTATPTLGVGSCQLLSQGKTAAADSTLSGLYPASKVCDGKIGSNYDRWISGSAAEHWCKIDLGQPCQLCSVWVYSDEAYVVSPGDGNKMYNVSKYTIRASMDGAGDPSTWTTLATYDNACGTPYPDYPGDGVEAHNTHAVTGVYRYVAMHITGGDGDCGANTRVQEMKVFGGLAPTTPTPPQSTSTPTVTPTATRSHTPLPPPTSSLSTPTPEGGWTGMGDANHDCFVNGDDFRMVRDHFGSVGCGVGDASGDCFVNGDDFRAVRDYFGRAYCQ